VYGVLYGTFLTQLIKSIVILTLNLIWHVPLAIVLAIASFFIGLLPVVGSWTIYVPVAAYLALWRGDVWGGVLMLAIGMLINTLFISMYLRPKIAAEKSQVLNFYWMFIALVTGVYTFGLMGIIIGPVLISVLKAVFDAISADTLDGMPATLPAG
jgi:predicted PurR-regulated permease PerM